MDEKSKGIQYQRTHKAIIQAFMKLLNRMQFEKITVQNILDETPVTRATFYHHFHDKYEIAEQLQDEVEHQQEVAFQKLGTVPHNRQHEVIHEMILQNHDAIKALGKIHTERVDYRKRLEEKLADTYKKTSPTANPDVEARIYAAAMSEFELSLPDQSSLQHSPDYFNEVMLEVFLHLFQWENSDEIRRYLTSKLE